MGRRNEKKSRDNKRTGVKKRHLGLKLFLFVLILAGVTGGALLKLGYFGKLSDYLMPTDEANRLISYLGISDYDYTDRWGSSFTIKDTKDLVESSGVGYDKLKISLSGKPGFLPVTRGQFESIYEVLIDELEIDRLAHKSMFIYEVGKGEDVELDGVTYELIKTSAGEYYMEKEYGFPRDYVGKAVDVYVSNNEIILCLGESTTEVPINNAYAVRCEEEDNNRYLIFYVNSAMQKLMIKQDSSIELPEKGMLCDVIIFDGQVIRIADHSSELTEVKVLSYSDGLITADGYDDELYLSEDFNVYKINGAFKASQSAGTLIGYDKVSLYIKENMIEAALLTEDIRSKNIRVLISNSDYTSYYHGEVAITSDSDYTVTYGDNVEEHSAGERILFSNGSEQLKGGAARISAKDENGRITVTNIERQGGYPSYRGTIELSRDDKGVLIINELSIEEYLYGVLPSEMPVYYEMEALKAQAICARAYAYRQMENDKYSKYGAHLDDSIECQVYNNVPEDERAVYAVDDTYGVVPCYDDEVIEAFFFSTSCGTTSSNSAVWGGNQEPYLLDTMETELNDIANLSNEQNFRDFIDGKLGTDFIEADEPFFRWNVGYTTETLTNSINNHLYERIQAMPEYILAENAAGGFEKKSINSIGEVINVEVTKRGESGIVEEMIITGSAETILVMGQANARALLSPENVTIYKHDGSTVTDWTSLPSAYFYIDSDNGFSIKGGGFGHGVGMSQNGANDMAKLGYMATDIIAHYYSGTTIKDMYQMIGND